MRKCRCYQLIISPTFVALGAALLFGSVVIAGACLCWAIDNNCMRKVSAGDSLFIAGIKGLISGIVNSS